MIMISREINDDMWQTVLDLVGQMWGNLADIREIFPRNVLVFLSTGQVDIFVDVVSLRRFKFFSARVDIFQLSFYLKTFDSLSEITTQGVY